MLDSAAQKILVDIALFSQRIVNTLLKHDNRKTVESFRMDKIVVASGTVLEMLTKTLLHKERTIDDRLADWLDSKEPQICLDTLIQMDTLLNANTNNGAKVFFQTSRARSAPVQDKRSESMRLFQKRKDCFHFLLTTDVW